MSNVNETPATDPAIGESPAPKKRGRKRRILLAIALFAFLLLTTIVLIVGTWMFQLDREIAKRFEQKRFAPPVEFYSSPELIRAGQVLNPQELTSVFLRRGYRAREFGQPLQPSDFSLWPGDGCTSILPMKVANGADAANTDASKSLNGEIKTCVAFRHQPSSASSFSASAIIQTVQETTSSTAAAPKDIADDLPASSLNSNSEPDGDPGDETNENGLPPPAPEEDELVTRRSSDSEPVQIIAFNSQSEVVGTFAGANPRAVESAVLSPELYAQYYGDRPTLRTEVSLGQIPPACKDALLAIEDPAFLEHSGISFTGLIRAVLTNLRRGRFAQGGSTITQQLVKNYFLTEEKTLRRKFTEIAMSFL
ncbi:MAG: biosynthetic peptidoglycan transglycosylase, partial [Bdellovibrionales bacterium]|nr:biosynthetic peptidoglycan transglycosylase [Bdellovibrionales bacterium]